MLAPRSACRGAGADVDRFCRLQRRHVDTPFAKLLLQSLCIATGSYRLGAGARGRAPRASAIFPPAIAIPVVGLAAADRGTAILSGRQHRRVRRRARVGVLCAADASADSRPPPPSLRVRLRRSTRPGQGGTTIIVGTSDTLETLSRRYNVSSAAILQANGYKGPRALSPGQQLIIPRQTAAVAAPAPALTAPASKPVAAAPRRAFMSSIAATPCSASRAAINVPVGGIGKGQRPRSLGQTQARQQAHRARRKNRGGACCRSRRRCRRSAGRDIDAACHQDGRGRAVRSKARGWPRPPPRSKKLRRPKRRSRPPKQPARCRPSAGRCAAR